MVQPVKLSTEYAFDLVLAEMKNKVEGLSCDVVITKTALGKTCEDFSNILDEKAAYEHVLENRDDFNATSSGSLQVGPPDDIGLPTYALINHRTIPPTYFSFYRNKRGIWKIKSLHKNNGNSVQGRY